MIDPDAQLYVQFNAAQWNMIMQIMAEAPMPHRIVDPYIRSIQLQCETQKDPLENIVPMKA